MSTPTITNLDLLHQLKITGKIPELIAGILQQRILEDQAQQLDLEITDDELQAGADQFRAANHLDTIAATEKWLADRLLSMDDFEQLVTTNLLTHKVSQQLFASKVEPFFHQHILDYGGAIISEIILQDYQLAIELFYAIQEGDMSFGEVVRDYAQDQKQPSDGYRGLVKRSQMPPELSAVVFAAQPPKLLPPIRIANKTHLILVTEIVPPQLSTTVREQILWDLFQDWMQQKIKKQHEQLDLRNCTA
jgi:parvulin-like peptidyl-prolyl isomerase